MNNEKHFDPSATGVANGHYFGFPYTLAEAETVIYPVAWDVTTSYGGGASRGPEAILEASPQLDFHDFDYPLAWQHRIGTHPGNDLCTENDRWRDEALRIIAVLESGQDISSHREALEKINAACHTVNTRTENDTAELLSLGKKAILLGGDHSCPLGYLRALAERHEDFGILHIDAHADLRNAYEGFEFSHASIMYNALKLPQITRLVQVGVRDICPDEISLIDRSNGRISLWDDYTLHRRMFSGDTWDALCREIVEDLPQKVYVSFDIDGLDPSLCPGTGTPVPGGMTFQQASHLLTTLHRSGRNIVGADLCEVSPSPGNEWDANVGARILYKLCSLLRTAK